MSATVNVDDFRPAVTSGADAPVDVVLVAWPSNSGLREVCQRSGLPRLLLVEPGAALPAVTECLEDWVWAGADTWEIEQRCGALRQRAGEHGHLPPLLDENGLLHFNKQWVALSPVEVRLLTVLLDHPGEVVGHQQLVDAAWPDHASNDATLRPSVSRLRHRIEALGLGLKAVHRRGYILDLSTRR